VQDVFPFHVVQTSSEANPAAYTMGTGALFPGVKRSVREADYSPPTDAEVKNTWIYTFTPP
jgi:FKBP-type peptidyl-prolyl cis-trans isomerase 2